MASESSANEPGTPIPNQSVAGAPQAPPPTITQPPVHTDASTSTPHDQSFPFYSGQDGAQTGDPPHSTTNAESGGSGAGGMGVQVPYPPMSVYPYGNVMPGPPPMTRPKRTQCKNACTNCQKACKKCDDNRPCQRCLRYGTTETCVDSKRKERKKGVKRGPYKKRDNKGLNAGENDDGSGAHTANGAHGPPPNMPYVGPVGYPPGMWSSYTPVPNGKLEGGAYYQPVFALTPVGGQPPHSGDGESTGGGSDAPHFPVGFYPATFISYPGPYPPYPIPHSQGAPHGFHYPYPPPPGMFHPRLPHVSQGNSNNERGASGSSADAHNKDASGTSAVVVGKKNKDSEPQVNGKAKVAEPRVDDASGKQTE